MIDCPHWSNCGVVDGGCCAISKFTARPSHGICRKCLGLPVFAPAPPTPAPSEHWGPPMWRSLHSHEWSTNAGENQRWLCAWLSRIPCGDCSIHFHRWSNANPPDYSSPEAMRRWAWIAHNMVNERRGVAAPFSVANASGSLSALQVSAQRPT